MADRIDFLARWRAVVADREAQSVRLRGTASPATEDFWGADRAKFFAQLARNLSPADPLFRLVKAEVRPDDTVLDVGAGAGRYAVALAPLVREVVALDPSPGMVAACEAVASEAGVRNVRTITGPWPETAAQAGQADVVICSHAFYWVEDIGAYLRALDAAARRAVFVAIRLEGFDWYLHDLFEQVTGERRSPEPNAIDLVGALRDVGIAASMEIGPGFGRTYETEDAAVEQSTETLANAGATVLAETVRARIRPMLEERDGRLALRNAWAYTAIVHWRKDR